MWLSKARILHLYMGIIYAESHLYVSYSPGPTPARWYRATRSGHLVANLNSHAKAIPCKNSMFYLSTTKQKALLYCAISVLSACGRLGYDENTIDMAGPGGPGSIIESEDDFFAETEGPTNYYELTWLTAERIENVSEPLRCETDPALSPDGQWLFLTRTRADVPDPQQGNACFTDREIVVYRWNDSEPEYSGVIEVPGYLGTASNVDISDGARYGTSDQWRMYFASHGPWAVNSIALDRQDPLSIVGEPKLVDLPSSLSAPRDPSLNADATSLVVSYDFGLLAEVTGTPGDYNNLSLIDGLDIGQANIADPALSPDGRVLVFAYQSDVWISRRREPHHSFGPAERLPLGDGLVNTSQGESGPHITRSGDLIYTSKRFDGYTRLMVCAGTAVAHLVF